MGLEIFVVVEVVHIWKVYLPLCVVAAVVGDCPCCLSFEVDFLLPDVSPVKVGPPFPCKDLPYAPGFDIRLFAGFAMARRSCSRLGTLVSWMLVLFWILVVTLVMAA